LLKQSNALFGYEGDKYYFDIDIRKHFGLDKYDSDIIPYWKTETVEAAMERNPVCFNDLNGKSTEDVFNILYDMPDNSIYDSNRLAQPDEVWNFGRGDGIEKSIRISGRNYEIT
jgi:hypothetical protein